MFMAAMTVSTFLSGNALMHKNANYAIPAPFVDAASAIFTSPVLPSATVETDLYQRPIHHKEMESPLYIPTATVVPVQHVAPSRISISYHDATHAVNAYSSKVNSALAKLAGPYVPDVKRAAAAHHLPPRLIASVVYVETTGKKGIRVSSSGAIGPMQLMPKTARNKLHVNPWNPAENIDGGTQYLSELVEQFKSVKLALIAYNEGPTAVMRGHYNQQSIDYADKVLALASGDTIQEVKYMPG